MHKLRCEVYSDEEINDAQRMIPESALLLGTMVVEDSDILICSFAIHGGKADEAAENPSATLGNAGEIPSARMMLSTLCANYALLPLASPQLAPTIRPSVRVTNARALRTTMLATDDEVCVDEICETMGGVEEEAKLAWLAATAKVDDDDDAKPVLAPPTTIKKGNHPPARACPYLVAMPCGVVGLTLCLAHEWTVPVARF